jgi:hypothetical protein
MEHSYSEKIQLSGQHQPLLEDDYTQPFSALNLALWLSFSGLFGSATLVSLKGQINMAFTMPVAAVLFIFLVLALFCYRRATTFHHDRANELKFLKESMVNPPEETVSHKDSNVVVLQPVRNKNGRVSYQRA